MEQKFNLSQRAFWYLFPKKAKLKFINNEILTSKCENKFEFLLDEDYEFSPLHLEYGVKKLLGNIGYITIDEIETIGKISKLCNLGDFEIKCDIKIDERTKIGKDKLEALAIFAELFSLDRLVKVLKDDYFDGFTSLDVLLAAKEISKTLVLNCSDIHNAGRIFSSRFCKNLGYYFNHGDGKKYLKTKEARPLLDAIVLDSITCTERYLMEAYQGELLDYIFTDILIAKEYNAYKDFSKFLVWMKENGERENAENFFRVIKLTKEEEWELIEHPLLFTVYLENTISISCEIMFRYLACNKVVPLRLLADYLKTHNSNELAKMEQEEVPSLSLKMESNRLLHDYLKYRNEQENFLDFCIDNSIIVPISFWTSMPKDEAESLFSCDDYAHYFETASSYVECGLKLCVEDLETIIDCGYYDTARRYYQFHHKDM